MFQNPRRKIELFIGLKKKIPLWDRKSITRKKLENSASICRLMDMLLNNQQGKEEIKKGNNKLPWDKNENTTYQNFWNVAKAVLRGTF